MKKLQGACEVFQLNLNFHSAGEMGIGTAAYLHLAASVPALPHALDTHILELAGDVVKPGVIRLTERGTMPVPTGPGLGVELDPEKFAVAVEAHKTPGRQKRLCRGRRARRASFPSNRCIERDPVVGPLPPWRDTREWSPALEARAPGLAGSSFTEKGGQRERRAGVEDEFSRTLFLGHGLDRPQSRRGKRGLIIDDCWTE